jgi:hypothetical protein
MCGQISHVIKQIAEAKFDGIIDISPAPVGDLDFKLANKILTAKNKILADGIHCNAFILPDVHQFEAGICELLDSILYKDYFMLGSDDAVPQGATLKHFDIIRKLLNA